MLCYGQTRSLRNALTCARARTPHQRCAAEVCAAVWTKALKIWERERERAKEDESCAAAYGIPVSTMQTTQTDFKSQDSSLVYTIIRPH